MNCANCGAEIKHGLKFCTNCGANLSRQVVQSEPEQVQTPTASMDVPATPEGAVPLQKRNTQRTIAIACGLLILLVVVFVGGLFLWKVLTPKELLLDADTIKDEALLNTLTVKYDKDGDGKLSEEELGEVQTLELDSGNDYSYLYLFRNLTSVNVKNSDVTSLDLSKNDNLKNADFRDAPNIADIKLPNMPSYDDVKLPDNDNVNVTFPENSEYEVKYVPKKVEQGGQTYEQDIENAFKVNSLSSNSSLAPYSNNNTLKYTYDNSGRISNSGNFKYFFNDDNKLIQQQSSYANAPTSNYNNFNFEYYENGEADVVGSYKFTTNDNGISLDYISENSAYSSTTSLWSFESEKLSDYVYHVGNGSSYTRNLYEYDEKGNCVKLSVFSFAGQNVDDDAKKHNSPEEQLYSLNFEYDNENKPIKATFSSGGQGVYKYNSKGYLTSVSFDATTDAHLDVGKLNCSISYTAVIAKKNQTPLSFLVIPGKTSKNIINLFTYTRQIGFTYDWKDANFAGKFWWDEENIINNQVEAAKAREAMGTSSDTAELATANNDALNNEAKEAYKSKISEYAQYQGVEFKSHINDTGTVNFLAMGDFGTDIYYCLYDLNSDGIDELLIKCAANTDAYDSDYIADAYTFVDGSVKRVLLSWGRNNYAICKNSCLRHHGSSGWNAWTSEIVKFEGPFVFDDSDKGAYGNQYAKSNTIVKLQSTGENAYEKGPYYVTREDGERRQVTDTEQSQVYQEINNYEKESISWTPITQNL